MKIFIKIKRAIPLLRALFRQYKDNRFANAYLERLLNNAGNQYMMNEIHPVELGPENPKRMIGLIKLPPEWIPTAGFFALFHRMLCGLYFADKMGMVPVVDCWNDCAYEEPVPVNGSKNVFEYYVKPVSDISLKSALNSQCVMKIINPNMDMVFFDYKCEWFDMSDDYIEEMGRLCREYIRFNEATARAIENDRKQVYREGKTLGVHFRGTDYAIGAMGHPYALSVEDYYEFIDEALNKCGFQYIFLATDDKNALQKMRERYAGILCYSDVLRGEGKMSVAFVESNDTELPNYRRGYEVLRDVMTLSRCDGLIAGQSQVSTGARIFNASGEHQYVYCRILSKGICRAGVDWIKEYNRTVRKEKTKVNADIGDLT